MVDLPRRHPSLVTVEEPRSRLSESDVKAPFASLAQALGDVGAAAEQVAEPLAEKAGVKSVSTGDDGKPVINRGPLPIVGKAGDAFERTAKLTYMARTQPQVDDTLLKMRLENPHDPDAYLMAGRAYADQISANAEKAGGPVLGEAVRQYAEHHVSQNYRASLIQTDSLNVQNALAAYKSRLGDLDNNMAALARQSGVDTPEYQALQTEALAVWKELGADKRFKYPQDRIDNEVGHMADSHIAQGIIGYLRTFLDKKTPTAKAEAQKWLQDQMWDPKVLPRLSPAERQGFVAQGMGWLEAQTSENKALRDAHAKLVTEKIEGLKSGAPYDPRMVNDLKQRATELGDVESYYKLVSYEALKGPRDGLFKQPISDQIAVLRSLQTGPTSFEATLIGAESSRNPAKVNQLGYAGLYQFGAPRLETIGLYKRGAGENFDTWSTTPRDAPGKWTGTFNIPGFPQVKTKDDFLANPEAQRAAFLIHKSAMDREIAANGLDQYEGRVVGGVQITREGLYGMLHLGGEKSTKLALESGGKINPKDENEKTVLDYARLGRPTITASTGAGSMWGEAVREEFVNDLRKHYATEAEKMTTTAETALGKGRRLSDDEVHNLAEVITATGRTDLAERMSIAIHGFDAGTKLTGLPIALRNTWRAAMQVRAADAPDPLERKVIDFADEMVKRVQTDMAEKPYTTGAARGLHVAPFPLDPSDPAAFAAAVKQRSAMDKVHQIHDGAGPRSVFEPGEAEAFRGALVNAKPEQIAGLVQGLKQLDDAQLVATLENKAVQDGVRNAMRTRDPARYSALMSGLDGLYGRLSTDFTRLMGEDAWHNLKTWQANLRYLDAKTFNEERNRLAEPQATAARKAELAHAEEIAKTHSAADIEAGIDTIWTRAFWPAPANPLVLDPQTRQTLVGDYQTIFARRYLETQDETTARDQTLELMRHKWSRSALNEGRLMLNAPEATYPQINGSHAWMKGQIESELEKKLGPRYERTPMALVGPNPLGSAVPVWDYSIVPDRQTAADIIANKPASYMVMVRNNRTHKIGPVWEENGLPMRFTWDIGPYRDVVRKNFADERQRVFNPATPEINLSSVMR